MIVELKPDGKGGYRMPGPAKFGRIYRVEKDGESGYNYTTLEALDDPSDLERIAKIEKYPTFRGWETDFIDVKEAEKKLDELTGRRKYEVSSKLVELGFEDGEVGKLLDKVFGESISARETTGVDVDLGYIDVSKLNNVQLNTLMDLKTSWHSQHLNLYFDENSHLILTTNFRYQEEKRDTYSYPNCWIPQMIDYVYGVARYTYDKTKELL